MITKRLLELSIVVILFSGFWFILGKNKMNPDKSRREPCEELREQVRLRLSQLGGQDPSPLTLEHIKESYHKSKHRVSDFEPIQSIFRLAQPETADELLVEIVHRENGLLALEAATALAWMRNKEGFFVFEKVAELSNSPGLFEFSTNSNVAFFYAKAGYLLLGFPVPSKLKNKFSVFADCEQLIDACMKAQEKQPST